MSPGKRAPLTGGQRHRGAAAVLATASLLAVAVVSQALLRPQPSSLLAGKTLRVVQLTDKQKNAKFSFGNDVSSAGIEEAAGEAWRQVENTTAPFMDINDPSHVNPGDIRHGAVLGLKVCIHARMMHVPDYCARGAHHSRNTSSLTHTHSTGSRRARGP